MKSKEKVLVENCVNDCSGCRVCQYICPVQAIDFYEDEEGFLLPKVDREKCINCKKCISYCQNKKNYIRTNQDTKKIYAARHKNPEIVRDSSSGGIFSALAEHIILNDGIVYGVGMNENAMPVYMRITAIEEIDKLRGSKYVEAIWNEEVIAQLFNDIDEDKNILFVGTPCTVAGVQQICNIQKKNTDKVFWVDLLCAGVLSRKIWKGYLQKYQGQKIQNVSFRNKDKGWREFSLKVQSDDRIDRKIFGLTDLGKLFFKDETKRKSCLNCKYSSLERAGDITLGDFWNEIYLPRKWQDNKGVSKLLVNTKKGNDMLLALQKEVEFISMKFYTCYCSVLEESSHAQNMELRESFWNEYNEKGYEFIAQKYGKQSISDLFLYRLVRPLLVKTHLIKYLIWFMNCKGTNRFKRKYEDK